MFYNLIKYKIPACGLEKTNGSCYNLFNLILSLRGRKNEHSFHLSLWNKRIKAGLIPPLLLLGAFPLQLPLLLLLLEGAWVTCLHESI